MPFTLEPDEKIFAGRPIFDDKGARPGAGHAISLLALLEAVDIVTTDEGKPFSWPSVDVVTDRNSLRNLIRWIDSPNRLDDFRIDLYIAGSGTLILTRWKATTQVLALPGSYGFSYEKNETVAAPGCEQGDEAGHDRILSYVSHVLTLKVRCEIDRS
jgi:hypothetical protein